MKIIIPEWEHNTLSDEQLIPQIDRMRRQLESIPAETLIKNSGVTVRDDKYYIDVLFQELEIDPNEFNIYDPAGDAVNMMGRSIILSYLTMADDTPPSNRLISFRELPGGSNYCKAFQGYAPDRLAKHFMQDIDQLTTTCAGIGGKPIDLGDVGFEFDVFPKMKITMVYYLGENMFPPSASLLFDANVSHYMVTAGMASIGYHLVDTIIINSGNAF